MKISSLLLAFLVLGACANRNSAPREEVAQQSLGLTRAEVVKKLGPPSDTQGDRYFWNLLRKDIVSPTWSTFGVDAAGTGNNQASGEALELYEFIFKNDRLVQIRPTH